MEKLFQYSMSRINTVNLDFKRYLWNRINWNSRLIAITGARGVGKTTMLLQYIKENLSDRPGEVIYVSLDDLFFSGTTIVDFADAFVKRGGKYLFLDEIHKYRNWSEEIKNIYDYFGDLHIVITGSSALDIFKGTADLSRRAILYKMEGLSFREFIQLKYKHQFPVINLEEVLHHSDAFARSIVQQIRPIQLFGEYLRNGYYPFFVEDEVTFLDRLKQIVNHVLEVDLPTVEKIDFGSVHKLRVLLSIISGMVPFKPNIAKLSQQIGISRETLIKYLFLLARADLIMLLSSGTKGISRMNKPEKIFLNNTNLMYALTGENVNQGTLRETYLYNQLKTNYAVNSSEKADFLVDYKYTIEVGGKSKTGKQIAGIENAFIASDNIEYVSQNKIPLWLFGFLY